MAAFTTGFGGSLGPGPGKAGAANDICMRESAVKARPVIMVLMDGMVTLLFGLDL